jgi:hypothetical protein
MPTQPPTSMRQLPPGVFALAIGIFTVSAVTGIHSMLTGARLNLAEELPIFLFQILVVSIPFLLLALLNIRSALPWLVGVILTGALWSYYLYDAVSHHGDGRGANIGLGLILLASPFVISTICLVLGRRESAQTESNLP